MAKKENSKRHSRAAAVSTKPVRATSQAAEKRAAAPGLKPSAAQRDSNEPSSSPASLAESARRVASQLWPAMLPVALAIIASINTLGNGFATDDLQQVVRNDLIKKLANLPVAFTTSVWGFASESIIFTVDQYYRPLFNVLLTINYAIGGLSPWLWHLVNVLIHAAAALLVFVVIKELFGRRLVAAIAASIFAVHPAHAESVAWVSGVTDPLMSVMLLSAFYLYLRYRKSGRKRLMIAALVFYLLGLLSKETAFAFPLVVACLELFYFGDSRSLKQKAMRGLAMAAWFLAPIAFYLLLRYNALGSVTLTNEPRNSLGQTLLTLPLVIAQYLKLMFVPVGYSYQHYTALVESPTSLRFIGPLLLIAAITVGVLLTKSSALRLAALWFIVFLAPALAGISRFDPEYLFQERYLYLPSMGICLAIALGIEWLAERKDFIPHARKVAAAITAIIVLVLGVIHIKQNRVWLDSVSVYRHVVEVNPDSAIAHASLARAYYESGRPREADAEAETALQLDPKSPAPYLTLAYFAQQTTKLNKAIYYLETAVSEVSVSPQTRKEMATIHLNLAMLHSDRAGYIFKQSKRTDEAELARAEENYRRSLEIWARPVGWYYAGQFYLGAGRYEEAIAMYEMVINNIPRAFAPVHRELGLAYQGLNQIDRAIAEFKKYLELAPPDAKDRKDIESHITRLQTGR